MPRQPQTEEQRDEIRRRILAAAMDLLQTVGLAGVSMRAIGARVGLTAPALYTYFPNKLELVRALWQDALGDLSRTLRRLSEQEPDPIAALARLAHAYASFAVENPVRFRILFPDTNDGSVPEWENNAQIAQAYGVVRCRVSQAIAQGRIEISDPDVAAQILWAAIHGLINLLCSPTTFPFQPPEVLLPVMIKTVLAGLGATPSED